jgi:hypothetical protein
MDAGLSSDKYVLVLERSWGGGNHQIEGLGAARHAWLIAWCEAHATKTPRRVVRVFPATWRARMGIRKFSVALGSAREQEMRAACRLLEGHTPGPDESAAILIGKWSCHAGEVAAALVSKPKKAKAA